MVNPNFSKTEMLKGGLIIEKLVGSKAIYILSQNLLSYVDSSSAFLSRPT